MHDVKRREQLYADLRRALVKSSSKELRGWAWRSAGRLPPIATRRLKNLGKLASGVFTVGGRELWDAFSAWKRGDFGNHVGNRTADAIDGSIEISKSVARTVGTIGKALIQDPKKTAPDLFALALGFYAGSGGLDGDGGIPDTDLALGIGWHRSVLTHSIVSGVVVEGAILAVADLADVVRVRLPEGHDPFWEKLSAMKDSIAHKLSAGTSAGIAYHLGVDATIQEAPYKDLPFGMPMEGHQALMGINAAAEGIDALKKSETTGQRVVHVAKDVGTRSAQQARIGYAYLRGFVRGLLQNRQAPCQSSFCLKTSATSGQRRNAPKSCLKSFEYQQK